jgi:DNA-binding CsgD family transcriptional regulator
MWGGLPLHILTGLGITDILLFWSVPHIAAIGAAFIASGMAFHAVGWKGWRRIALAAGMVLVVGYCLLLCGREVALATGLSLLLLLVLGAVSMGVGTALVFSVLAFMLGSLDEEHLIKDLLVSLVISSLAFLALMQGSEGLLLACFGVSVLLLVILLLLAIGQAEKASLSGRSAHRKRGAQPGPEQSGIVLLHKPSALRVAASSDEKAPGQAGARAMPGPFLSIAASIREPFLCVAAIMFAIALTRSIALRGLADASVISAADGFGAAAAALVLYLIRYGLGGLLRGLRDFDIERFYLVLFPTMATALVLLSLLGDQFVLASGTLVYMVFMVSFALILPSTAIIARIEGYAPLRVFCIFMGGIHLVFAAATVLALILYYYADLGAATIPVGALLAVYVLAMIYTVLHNRLRRTQSTQANEQAVAVPPSSAQSRGGLWRTVIPPRPTGAARKSDARQKPSGHSGNVSHSSLKGTTGQSDVLAPEDEAVGTPADPIALKCAGLGIRFSLTEREGDIMVLLAHGRSVPAIAQQLFISENTVRTHTKALYLKLSIHSKQEMLDLLEQE